MTLKSLGLALAAGIAAFLLVAVAVTELAQPWVAFSLFLGLPAGLVAGAVVVTLVAFSAGDDDPRRRRLALSSGVFGAVFLGVLVVAGGLLEVGTVVSLVLAAVVGAVAALGSYLRGR